MNEEEKQRGYELQGYIDSIRDMTIKEVAIKYLKKHHLPKFLARLLVKFSYPLLLAKDYELTELQTQIAELNYQKQARSIAENAVVDLTKENEELKARLNAINLLTPELEKKSQLKTQQLTKAKEIINDLVHLGEFNENTDEEYLNYQVHEALKNAEQFLNSEVVK